MDYVYVCTTGEKRFKIGYTKRTPEKRRKEHATGNPSDLNPVVEFQLDKARKLETFLKNRFYKYKCKTGTSTEHYEYNCTIDELRERIQEEKKLFDELLLLEEQADQYEKCNSSNEMKEYVLYKKSLYRRDPKSEHRKKLSSYRDAISK